MTSATCTFRFGSINLGSNAYVSGGNATFGGSGNSKSTITWTATTHTLTITLGADRAGTLATVNSSTPIYTASGLITDSPGAAISNSPFTLPPRNSSDAIRQNDFYVRDGASSPGRAPSLRMRV